jgi:hypothetical protein
MAAGYHVIRYEPDETRTTWDVVVAEGEQKIILVEIKCHTDADSKRVRNELVALLDRFH